MSRVRRGLAVTLVALVALVGGAVSATAVQAMPPPDPYDPEPPCEWESGGWHTDSGCDGLSAGYGGDHWDLCGYGVVVDDAEIWGGGRFLAEVLLTYYRGPRSSAYPGGACRTVKATLTIHASGASCYAKIQRDSDGARFYISTVPGGWVDSQVLYDAGVTSQAWGSCSYNGRRYSNGTIHY